MGILMLVAICVRVSDSNIDYRFMLVFPQSSEEDITSVCIVGLVGLMILPCTDSLERRFVRHVFREYFISENQLLKGGEQGTIAGEKQNAFYKKAIFSIYIQWTYYNCFSSIFGGPRPPLHFRRFSSTSSSFSGIISRFLPSTINFSPEPLTSTSHRPFLVDSLFTLTNSPFNSGVTVKFWRVMISPPAISSVMTEVASQSSLSLRGRNTCTSIRMLSLMSMFISSTPPLKVPTSFPWIFSNLSPGLTSVKIPNAPSTRSTQKCAVLVSLRCKPGFCLTLVLVMLAQRRSFGLKSS
jgi:hypothetical protein